MKYRGKHIKIEKLRVNHLDNPLGYGIEGPGFSWVVTESAGTKQMWVHIEVSSSPFFQELLHDSGRREDISSLGYYPKLSLKPYTRYYWHVTVMDELGDCGISETAWFETGKMDEKWEAVWITPPYDKKVHPLFAKEFTVDGQIKQARAYVCGLGVFELFINGSRAGDQVLAPYYNDYMNWVQYITYDITDALGQGENCIGASLGNGWYKGRFGYIDKLEELYGDKFLLLCEVRITYEDGRVCVIGTDTSWRCHTSPVLESSIYDGEVYDSRLEVKKFTDPSLTYDMWETAAEADFPMDKLKARLSPPLRVKEIRNPLQILRTPLGEWVVDFGQNMTGWFSFRCREQEGKHIHIQCGEILQKGCFYNENLRTARAAFTYIADGSDRLVHPHFTFYGFRYLKVEGCERVREEDFRGLVIYSDIEETGEILTSDERINRLILNTKWGQKGNFLDVPTDCPQRDERMGWTGDAQIFAPTASFHMYTPAFYHKYLYDMFLEQKNLSGSVPHVVPDILGQIMKVTHQEGIHYGSCAWGDAACVIPWTLYMFYGDKELLRQHYGNMKMWVDYIQSVDKEHCNGSRLWKFGFHYADWLALDNPKAEDSMGGTDPYYVATAYYFYSASLLSLASGVLELPVEEKYYGKLADEVKDAIRTEYFTESGQLKLTTQTAYVLALYFGFAPEEYRGRLADCLVEKLEEKNVHLDTGFVGTPYLCPVLSENGKNSYAYTLLLNVDYPSWLYEVGMGATTIWERWNSVLPDGTLSDTGMNSLNHYAYGSIAEWMYRYMCGLNPVKDGAGFKKTVIWPMPDKRFSWVRMSYESAAGRYETEWEFQGNRIRFRVRVPFDAEARFVVPNGGNHVRLNGVEIHKKDLENIMLVCGEHEIQWELI